MVKEVAYSDRDFLNDPSYGSIASYDIRIENHYRYENTEAVYEPYISNGHMKISDCYKVITLEFAFGNEGEAENSINKLKRLRAAADEAIKYIDSAKKYYEKPKEE